MALLNTFDATSYFSMDSFSGPLLWFIFLHNLLSHTAEHRVIIFLSALLWNCYQCWDRWNGDVTPTLDVALLCSSNVGSDLGHL